MTPAWVGVDLGTQSVRAVVVTSTGTVLAQAREELRSRRDGNRHEQDPEDWWEAVVQVLRRSLAGTHAAVQGIAVCGTSGTVLLADAGTLRPLGPALMYDDGRADAEARLADERGGDLWPRLGYRSMPAVWALPKLLWLLREYGSDGTRLMHQTDFVAGRLVGGPVATDTSSALKTGVDAEAIEWPAALRQLLPLGAVELPEVVLPGALLGEVGAAAAEATGLSVGTPVLAGMTDGCAAQISAGALAEGQWNSVLGTTLVLKGVTRQRLSDPVGAVYSHRSPDGVWLPGGASSVGSATGLLSADADRPSLDRAAGEGPLPSGIAYPLVGGSGERFPFSAPAARPFLLDVAEEDPTAVYVAVGKGIAAMERLALSHLRSLGAAVSGPLRVTGGGTASAAWTRIRASMLGRPLEIPEIQEPAFGMAVLAARNGRSLAAAASEMGRVGATIDPDPALHETLTHDYLTLVGGLEDRGWLPPEMAAWARKDTL